MTEASDAIRDQDRLLPIANIRYTTHRLLRCSHI